MIDRSILVVIVMSAALLSAAAQAQQKAGGDVLVTNVRVFDGRQTLPNTHVAVNGGIIRAVGGDVAAWRSLPTIDGTDATLVPGFIDAHVHVRDAGDLRQALRFGVTTALDMATIAITPGALSALRATASAATDMADVRSAGYPATSPNGHGTQFGTSIPRVSALVSAKEFVAMRRTEGSDYLKIMLNGVRVMRSGMTNLDEGQVKALVDAAHDAGLLAVAHVETLGDVRIALAAGVDGLVHVWRRGGASPDVARALAERKAFVVPTLAVMEGFLPEGRARLLADPRFQSVLSTPIKEHLSRSFSPATSSADALRDNFDASVAAVRGLHQAGVRLLVGSDAGRGNPASHGISVHRELELLAKAGLAPSEVLAAATANVAEAFRLADRGRILPGGRADMLLVRGDPTTDVLLARDIVRIWKLGVEVDRAVTER
jgi:imidazolonepropionase-like amidohydrolase